MAYDHELSERFRNALEGYSNITEKKMMGGLCFLHCGNMIGGADRSKEGVPRFMFRVGKDNHEKALKRAGAEPMIMGQRTMRGFIFVNADQCNKRQLQSWVQTSMKFVGTLPDK